MHAVLVPASTDRCAHGKDSESSEARRGHEPDVVSGAEHGSASIVLYALATNRRRWQNCASNHDGIAMRGPDKIKRVRRTKYSGAPTVTLPPADELGPAMRALTERQRRFVLELSTGPIAYGHLARAAKAAGYSDRGKNVLDTVAGHLLRSDKIQAALREIGIKIVRAEAFQAIRHVAAIAMNSKHKDQLKACVELMNRGGFSFEQQHNIAVTHEHRYSSLSADEVIARIAALASQTGIEPAKLPAPVTIEGKAEEPA